MSTLENRVCCESKSLSVRDRSSWTWSKANSAIRIIANRQVMTKSRNAEKYQGSGGVLIKIGIKAQRTETPSASNHQERKIIQEVASIFVFAFSNLFLFEVDTNFSPKPKGYYCAMTNSDPTTIGYESFQCKRVQTLFRRTLCISNPHR